MNQMFSNGSRRVVIAKSPPISAKHQIGVIAMPGPYGIRQTHYLEWDFLFSRAAYLLPFQGR